MKKTESPRAAFLCFGEVNTPYAHLVQRHDESLELLRARGLELVDGGVVIDDSAYEAADRALALLQRESFSSLILCVAGWIPPHAVLRAIDAFRHLPMVLWGLCGWMEGGTLVTAAGQAGTTALRPTLESMGIRFRFVYSVVGKEPPLDAITSYVRAAHAAERLRQARIGTMGYRDMLLYGTQYDGNRLRRQIGIEVEPFEMLEMLQNAEKADPRAVEAEIAYIRENWAIQGEFGDDRLEQGVRYALGIGKKIAERGYEAVTLTDVDGMKKLLGYPPAMVFLLLEHEAGVQTTPENDVMGNVTQLMLHFLTGQTIPYLEYYEFFEDSVLIGVPDYIPAAATEGKVQMRPAAFGLLNESLLNVSRVRGGTVTCARLFETENGYAMHLYLGEAEQPPRWNEYGWAPPAPQLPSLRVYPRDCTVPELAQKVSCQHVLLCYGDQRDAIRALCGLLSIEVV